MFSVPAFTQENEPTSHTVPLRVADAVPDASMVAEAAPCALDGFVIVNENAYCVPASTVWPVCTVSVSVPELNAPCPCVAPSENRSAPLLSTLVRARLAASGAFVSPDTVTTELSVACAKLTLL